MKNTATGTETGASASTTMRSTAQREDWVDVAKGLGILLVVIGHVWNGTPKAFIYMFHMPLFFFLSGYLSTVRNDKGKFLADKSISLLIPYVAFVVLLGSREIAKHAVAGRTDQFIWAFESTLLGGEVLQGWPGTAWFIVCLFFTQQLVNLLLSTFGMRRTTYVVLLLLALSYAQTWLFPTFWLPLALNVVAGAAPFYFAGYLYKRVTSSVSIKAAAFIAMLLGVVLFSMHVPLRYDMKTAYFGIPILSFVVALGFIVTLFGLCKLMAQRPSLAAPFMRLGEASLVIMFVHAPVYMVMIDKFHIKSVTLVVLVATGVSYVAYLTMRSTSLTRALFLGSRRDIQRLLEWRPGVQQA
ncbi:MAG: acyltransferase 3 [Rhodocyclales bacterium]|nr:acyltransferase 3 [Rhodocyclales bacterium]